MPRRVASATGRKVRPAPKGHKLAEEFPPGMVLRDLCKKDWLLGSVLGQGGFGLIYLASDNASRSVDPKTANYVIKIEPKGNGPLFCEIHFYQRVAKPSSIDAFVNKHRLRYLGIPPYTGTGLVTYKSQEYRFLVMPRCGKDLQKLLQECRGKFEPHTTFAVGLRMVDALQFLHENEYVHADIKAANILLGFSRGSEVKNEVYLVDYGLAYRYTVGSEHKDYKEDPKKAHNGTITFTSRDAHRGLAPSRRGDLEILGYCMLQWVCGKLPWENNLTNPTYVAECKEGFMKNVQAQVTACIPGNTHVSGCISSYFESVNRLAYNSEPNYNQIRGILRNGLAGSGQKDEWRIEFTSQTKVRKRSRKSKGQVDSKLINDFSGGISVNVENNGRIIENSPSSSESRQSLIQTLYSSEDLSYHMEVYMPFSIAAISLIFFTLYILFRNLNEDEDLKIVKKLLKPPSEEESPIL